MSEENLPERFVRVEPGEIVGFVASTHGDPSNLRKAVAALHERGAKRIFHAGDILGEGGAGPETLPSLTNLDCILGNHDLLSLGGDTVHEYSEPVLAGAMKIRRELEGDPVGLERLRAFPYRIVTPHFVVVHESVAPPYYARRGKRRRRSYGWDVGSTADENTHAVCYGRIDRPHFIGSDHIPYIIQAHPGTGFRVTRPEAGVSILLAPKSVVSLPSLFAPRDEFGLGYAWGRATKDGFEATFERLG